MKTQPPAALEYDRRWAAYLEAEAAWCAAGCPDSGPLDAAVDAAWKHYHAPIKPRSSGE